MMDRFDNYRARVAAAVARGIVIPPPELVHFGPSKPREDWAIDTRDLAERYAEMGSMQLHWAVENFKMAEQVRAFREAA